MLARTQCRDEVLHCIAVPALMRRGAHWGVVVDRGGAVGRGGAVERGGAVDAPYIC